jgi:hypothetical protein
MAAAPLPASDVRLIEVSLCAPLTARRYAIGRALRDAFKAWGCAMPIDLQRLIVAYTSFGLVYGWMEKLLVYGDMMQTDAEPVGTINCAPLVQDGFYIRPYTVLTLPNGLIVGGATDKCVADCVLSDTQ